MDGIARLWSREGVLQHSLNAHSESIFSLRFDSAGKRLLTGSYDKCVSVWDVRTGKLQHKFEAHSAQVLDVDWKTGGYHGLDVFASCSTDRTIAVCALADREADTDPAAATTTPLQVLVGHADEVNAIRWDPSGGLLASCSDDHQVLIWQLGQSLAQSMIDRQSFCHLPCSGPSRFIDSVITLRRYTQFVGHRLAKLRICRMYDLKDS
jgi:transducin (beta)-like 1